MTMLPDKKILQLHPDLYNVNDAQDLFEKLKLRIQWEERSIRMFGKWVKQPRLTALYGDSGASYTYSGLTLTPLPWTKELLEIRSRVEEFCQKDFNAVLLNFYRNGSDYMGWHADNEKELGPNPFIASLSLGVARKFQLKHKKEKTRMEIDLAPGSLIIMKENLQEHWLHRIASTKNESAERINLTFRKILLRPHSGPKF
jgi:alkylated DNA repair dioxygenase AlkB